MSAGRKVKKVIMRTDQTFVMTFLFRSPRLLNLPWEANGVRMRLVKDRKQRCPSKGSGVFATANTETIETGQWRCHFKKVLIFLNLPRCSRSFICFFASLNLFISISFFRFSTVSSSPSCSLLLESTALKMLYEINERIKLNLCQHVRFVFQLTDDCRWTWNWAFHSVRDASFVQLTH